MLNIYHDEFEARRMQILRENMLRYNEEFYASRALKPEELIALAKQDFNDIVIREFRLGLDDNSHLVDLETESIYQISERYIKYIDDEDPVIHPNEIEMNVIENPRLMEMLFGMWIVKWAKRKNVSVSSYYQSAMRGSKNGFFVVTYVDNGITKEYKSEVFINESLRIFNLVTKLNHTEHLYSKETLKRFDIEIIRKGQK